MIQFRDRGARGRHQGGQIDAHHSFSFADYEDPKHMGFRALRVLNEDRVVPGAGLPEHSHEDMEIVTIVLKGLSSIATTSATELSSARAKSSA